MPGRVHLHRHRVTGASYPSGRCPSCSRTVEVETARLTRTASSFRRPCASLPWHSGHTSGPTSSWTCTSAQVDGGAQCSGGYHVRSFGDRRDGQTSSLLFAATYGRARCSVRTPPVRLGCRGKMAGRRAGHGRAVRGLLALSPVMRLPRARGHEAQQGLIRTVGSEADSPSCGCGDRRPHA
jgi:hypothetical protein